MYVSVSVFVCELKKKKNIHTHTEKRGECKDYNLSQTYLLRMTNSYTLAVQSPEKFHL